MRQPIRYALVGDGMADRVLRYVIDWSIGQVAPTLVVAEPVFVARGGQSLQECLARTREQHGPDILIAHRDAEREPPDNRVAEIRAADGRATPIVPVHMTEAWLLISETALRRAADNPSGREPLGLPSLNRLEALPDPKQVLRSLLMQAGEVQGARRRRRFERDLGARIERVAALILDYSPLRQLPAYRSFQRDLTDAIRRLPSSHATQ